MRKILNHEGHEGHEGHEEVLSSDLPAIFPMARTFLLLSFVFFVSFVVQDVIAAPAPASQTVEEAHAKSIGCLSCHTASDRATMHQNPAVILGCTDCHGGNAKVEARGV